MATMIILIVMEYMATIFTQESWSFEPTTGIFNLSHLCLRLDKVKVEQRMRKTKSHLKIMRVICWKRQRCKLFLGKDGGAIELEKYKIIFILDDSLRQKIYG